jgi:hypothetical protein
MSLAVTRINHSASAILPPEALPPYLKKRI